MKNIYSNSCLQGYYLYAYIRSKDTKIAKKGTPYYLGKGSTNRAWTGKHSVSIPKDRKYIIILESNLTEMGALALEVFYIRWYGRQDNNTGILRNLSDGGEGPSGYKRSKNAIELSTNHNLKLVANGTHNLLGKSNPVHNLVANGIHHLLGGDIQRKDNERRINDGTHNFLDSDFQRNTALTLIEIGKHNFIANHPNKIQIECPHCNKIGGSILMRRWHFDNCISSPTYILPDNVICPHCNKIGEGNKNFISRHFDNCKESLEYDNKIVVCQHCRKKGTRRDLKDSHFSNCEKKK